MCGISGFTHPGPAAERILREMNTALAHRGPDGNGTHVDPSIALGHTRLAIIDPDGGAQPRVDEASGDALVFNGEIYGYRALADELRAAGVELRDGSDTEVLFQLIRREGVRRALGRIDGMFAFAFRQGNGPIYLARDRFGEKPLYYGIARGQLVFASEVTGLLRHPAFRDATPDRMAGYRFLLFEYLPGTDSGWEGIKKLEPGTLLTFENGRISGERYWRPSISPIPRQKIAESEAVERLDELLRGSVARRLVADVPVGILLSGGLDSSLIAAMAARAKPDVTAFTVRIAAEGFDESPHSMTVARHLGIKHEIVNVGETDMVQALDVISAKLGEPLGDSSLLPTYLVCRVARQSMTVALSGDGADELFAGYPNFIVQRYAPAMEFVPAGVGRLMGQVLRLMPSNGGYMNRRFVLQQLSQGFGEPATRPSFLWMAPFAPEAMRELWTTSALQNEMLDDAFAPIDRYTAEMPGLSAVNGLLRLFLLTYLSDDILTKTDRASMFNGLEVRAPFLDRDFAEYACRLPSTLKLRGRVGKHVIKSLALKYLPEQIVRRKKHGFAIPIGRLIRTLFWERFCDVLLSRRSPVSDWFERATIERLLAEHRAGRHDHGKKLWALYILFSIFDAPPRRVLLAAA
jgi:asparagine synthase (glutamine-hydrolysing)